MRQLVLVGLFTSALALATPLVQADVALSKHDITQPQLKQTNRQAGLPQRVRTVILQDMANRTFIPMSQLKVVQVKNSFFSGCLDVAPRDQGCTAIAIPGWQVTVTGNQYRWVYHATQNQGIKLNGFVSIPQSITRAALQDAAQRSRQPISQLQVNWVEQKTWSNGCFNLPTNGVCAAAMVPGWQVTIAHGQQRWVYRTDSSKTVQFDRAASKL